MAFEDLFENFDLTSAIPGLAAGAIGLFGSNQAADERTAAAQRAALLAEPLDVSSPVGATLFNPGGAGLSFSAPQSGLFTAAGAGASQALGALNALDPSAREAAELQRLQALRAPLIDEARNRLQTQLANRGRLGLARTGGISGMFNPEVAGLEESIARTQLGDIAAARDFSQQEQRFLADQAGSLVGTQNQIVDPLFRQSLLGIQGRLPSALAGLEASAGFANADGTAGLFSGLGEGAGSILSDLLGLGGSAAGQSGVAAGSGAGAGGAGTPTTPPSNASGVLGPLLGGPTGDPINAGLGLAQGDPTGAALDAVSQVPDIGAGVGSALPGLLAGTGDLAGAGIGLLTGNPVGAALDVAAAIPGVTPTTGVAAGASPAAGLGSLGTAALAGVFTAPVLAGVLSKLMGSKPNAAAREAWNNLFPTVAGTSPVTIPQGQPGAGQQGIPFTMPGGRTVYVDPDINNHIAGEGFRVVGTNDVLRPNIDTGALEVINFGGTVQAAQQRQQAINLGIDPRGQTTEQIQQAVQAQTGFQNDPNLSTRQRNVIANNPTLRQAYAAVGGNLTAKVPGQGNTILAELIAAALRNG